MTEDAKECIVYRCYSPAGDLLYVGSTINLKTRMVAHRGHAAWYADDVRIETEAYATPEMAFVREQALIAEHVPPHNKRRPPTVSDERPAGRPGATLARWGGDAEEPYLTVREMASYLGLKDPTVLHGAIYKGTLPALHAEQDRVYVRVSDVERYRRERRGRYGYPGPRLKE
jgi:predicted GIY-YIG superfamily endonuclease